jgi:hypothetical protein
MNEGGRLEEDPEGLQMIARAKRLRRRGASFGSISRALEMPKTTIYRLINANLRNRKHNYLNTIAN